MNSGLLLLARILLSILFIVAGFGKLADAAGSVGYFGSIGLPGGIVMVYLVGCLEFFGGLAVLVGFQVRIIASVLAIFCVATGLLAHLGNDPQQQIALMKNLGLCGGFLALAAAGAGAYSLDARSHRA